MKLIKNIVLLLCTAQLVLGCASGGQNTAAMSPESIVAARAEARWQAMIKKDLDSAYVFLSPGSKSVNSVATFKAKIRPLDWKTASVKEVTCAQDECKARLVIGFTDKRLGGLVETVVEENWLKDSGQWWLVFTH